MLKPQDIYLLLKLVAMGGLPWSYVELAAELRMSPSQVHASIKRVLAAQLAYKQDKKIRPHYGNLRNFLVHGLKHVFWAERGEMTRGVPTATSAPPLNDFFAGNESEPPEVWPDPEGEVRGMAFSPLYKQAPKAVKKDKRFYELLTLVDAVRSGRAREREIAINELKERFDQYAHNEPQP